MVAASFQQGTTAAHESKRFTPRTLRQRGARAKMKLLCQPRGRRVYCAR
jgi:hypothetical protein